jgi:hypothetical protein
LLDAFVDGGKKLFYLRNPCGNINFRGVHDEITPKIQEVLYKRNSFSNSSGNFLLD